MQSLLRAWAATRTSTTSAHPHQLRPAPQLLPAAERRRTRRSGAGRMLGHEDVDLFTFLPAARRRGPAGAEPRQHEVDPARRAAGLDHPQHRRLHAAHLERPPALDDAPREPAARRGASAGRPRVSFPMAVYVWEDEMLEVLPGLGPPKYEPIKAVRVPHAHHQQVLRRRLRGARSSPAPPPTVAARRGRRQQHAERRRRMPGCCTARPNSSST